jgi:hypothetical protein
MKEREDAARLANPLAGPKAPRKPYEKPAVRHERVFETRALTCGKVNTTQGACHSNRKTS